jgi:hypothetical protein
MVYWKLAILTGKKRAQEFRNTSSWFNRLPCSWGSS